jgi:hypothetical protein
VIEFKIFGRKLLIIRQVITDRIWDTTTGILMFIIRKMLLAMIALAFAFVVSSCNDPKKQQTPIESIIKEKQERHHRKW